MASEPLAHFVAALNFFMNKLLTEIRKCAVCAKHLPFGPRPMVQISSASKIVIIGQAPGRKVHDSGIPWNDASGEELRRWLGVTSDQFYDSRIFGLMPMGFCYPGKGASGDLPPRPECAPTWHGRILEKVKKAELTILIGQYSQKYYLGTQFNPTITENVKNFKKFLPQYFPLVHPSPRNRIWLKKNEWFMKKNIPILQKLVADIIDVPRKESKAKQ